MENQMKKKRLKAYALYTLVALMLTGNVFALRNVEIMGVVVSAYRVFIPGLAVFFACKRLYEKKVKKLFEDRIFIAYVVMLCIWIVWGATLLFISPYCNIIAGLKDLISLVLGLASIYGFYEICHEEEMFDKVLKCIRVVYVVVCIIALFEILTGIYMPFSKYYYGDMIEAADYGHLILYGLKSDMVYPTTTIFFNINDFSAFLSIFFPLFFIESQDGKLVKCFKIMVMYIALFIIAVNDSNIVIIGLILTLILHLLASKENRRFVSIVLSTILALFFGLNKLLCSLVITLKSNLPITIEDFWEKYGSITDMIAKKDLYDVTEVVSEQVAGSGGSLYSRVQITITSIKMTIESKLVGIGPGAFRNYIEKRVEDSVLVDPHNWWMEILSQYGIVVFMFYLIVTLIIVIKLYKSYFKRKKYTYLLVCCMFSIFAISCITPSSYLGYTYQWLLPAIGICLLKLDNVKRKE